MKNLIIISALATGFGCHVFAQFSEMKEKRSITPKETQFLMKNGIYVEDYDWRDNKINYHLNLGFKYKKQAKIYYIIFGATAVAGSVMAGAGGGTGSAVYIPGAIILSAALPCLGIGISKGGKAGKQFSHVSRMLDDYEPYRKRNIEDYYVPFYLHKHGGLPATRSNDAQPEMSFQLDQLIKETKAVREAFEGELSRIISLVKNDNPAPAVPKIPPREDDYSGGSKSDEPSEPEPGDNSDGLRLSVPCYVISCGVFGEESAAKRKAWELQQKGLSADYYYTPNYDRYGKPQYRVYVGPYSTKPQAENMLPKVGTKVPGAWVLWVERN